MCFHVSCSLKSTNGIKWHHVASGGNVLLCYTCLLVDGLPLNLRRRAATLHAMFPLRLYLSYLSYFFLFFPIILIVHLPELV